MTQRQPLVAANWKMNGSLETIRPLMDAVRTGLEQGITAEVAICPPFPYLQEVAGLCASRRLILGAQDLSEHAEGAYTGEVAGSMLADFQCKLVIVGHSERRMYYAESDERVARKFSRAIACNLIPILCVGESLEERESGDTEAVIARQLDAVVEMNGIEYFDKAVIAYEPVWAIGTGKTATPEQAQEVHSFIRLRLARHCNDIADNIRILYGGSVKANNAEELFKMADIDGGLIGGASLVADDFLMICRSI